MKNSSRWILCFLYFATCQTITYAGDRPGAFFVKPSVSYYLPAFKRHLKNAILPSFFAGYDFTERWAVAAGVTVVNTDQKSAIGGDPVHGFLYTLDGLYRFAPYRDFIPYALLGPQITSLKPATGSDPVTQFGASLGAGAQYFFSDSVHLSFEGRDLYTFSGGKNDILFTAGLGFLFG